MTTDASFDGWGVVINDVELVVIGHQKKEWSYQGVSIESSYFGANNSVTILRAFLYKSELTIAPLWHVIIRKVVPERTVMILLE